MSSSKERPARGRSITSNTPRVVDTSAAEARAKVRLEQLQRFETRAIAKGGCIRVQPGRVLSVEGCSDEFMNARYLVVTAEHSLALSSQHEQGSLTYQHRVLMVPADTRAHRPALPAKAPRIDGLESVVTTGAPGEEIHVDDLGRIKLRFLWDRAGITDDKSSAWTRSLQMAMGGSMLLPRVGWEVPIAYLDGYPERPLVLGRFYNATAPNPYGLPGASAKTTLQSETSPGGGTTNEIRMSDSAGSMELFVHASRDQTVNVGGSASTKVSVNETHDVGLAYTLTVKGSQTHNVAASQSLDIQTDAVIDVKGSRSESVGGAEIIDVTANRAVVTPGSYSEQIGALYGIQCNQSNTVVQGAFTQMIGAGLGLAAGLATQESVAAARSESVGGARTIAVAKSLNESIRGSKTITAGSAREKASSKVLIEVKGAAGIQAGEPVAVVSGAVVDELTDLVLVGRIHVEWKRLYSSGRNRERTPFGRGGFSHSLHQFVEIEDERIVFQNEAGTKIPFPRIDVGERAYHRGRRLTLLRHRDGRFEIEDALAQETREFAPLEGRAPQAMLCAIRDVWGNRVELAYEDGRLSCVIDTAKRELRLSYDGKDRIIAAELWAGGTAQQTVKYTYTPAGELESATDPLGHVESYAYDGDHRLVEKALKNGVRFYYQYERESGQCMKTWGDGGLYRVEFNHDPKRKQTITAGTPEPRIYTWNAAGAVVCEASFDGEYKKELVYEDDLYVLEEKNAAGETTKYEYDERGRMVTLTDAAGNQTKWEYTGESPHPARRSFADGHVTEYAYGVRDELIGVRYSTGLGYTIAYDGYGRIRGVYGPDGPMVELEWDDQHNLVRTLYPEGRSFQHEYDALGRKIKTTDPLGHTESVERNALGRPVARVLRDGMRLEMEYDALGNPTRISSQHGAPR